MKYRLLTASLICLLLNSRAFAAELFIPMDKTGQTNHLKAYGIAFAAMQKGIKVDWLLNYKGGSFGMKDSDELELLCMKRGVSFVKLSDKKYAQIVKEVSGKSFDGQIVKLEKAPKIAVYTPLNKEPWDDAVTLALTYAEIPFDKLYADEVLKGDLDKYDWLHLHHEDFTGQYGKFWAQFHNAAWYQLDQKTMEEMAARNGYKKVSDMQLAVVKKIRDFVATGGNMFAMCSATETFDIALAADGVDICDVPFDGDATDPNAQQKLDFAKTFAFKDFKISANAYEYSHSNIDNSNYRQVLPQAQDNFTLVTPSGKLDAVSLMLCQNHSQNIKGFMGQTTAFRKEVIKPNVMVLGNRLQAPTDKIPEGVTGLRSNFYTQDYEARYIHGEFGKGSWTFLGGHDPEAYQHRVGDATTDLSKYPNSPGYRLILNNVLFPAVKKTEVPTVVMNKTTAPMESENIPVKNNGVKIYPNPANDELVISLATEKIGQVTISNISGQEVFNHTYNTQQVSVDMNSLTPGMYLIKVNGEYAGKVVKQ